ncbi:MAG: deoxyguanosinetriphosphate triphosphohydrolase [Hyphomicrobiaceae bacterium]|nr:deoxyguanosinetriphosphate triphosphohydrolase [Hyphomicrobiaceae bacterium]
MQHESIVWTARPRELAPWAMLAAESRGRRHDEPACPMRNAFQRDRDRIVHATAFRRLNYKTQVFLLHEGDHYRSRLTHSLEVAQIARAIARQLGLDEDLAEALALSHDLGHPPFGHAGERALDRAMADVGGFDHNAQSLRVVTLLERKYWAFDGLNLSLETLEGLVKHNGPVDTAGQPLLAAAVHEAGLGDLLELSAEAPAEAQTAAVADDIAYNNHDIDDALRAGLVAFDELGDVPLVGRFVRDAARRPERDQRRAFYDVNRRMITAMIADVVAASRSRIAATAPRSVADVRLADGPLVGFSEAMTGELAGLKAYLFRHVYRHARVMRAMRGAESIVVDLFARYLADRTALPTERAALLADAAPARLARGVGDFIAGMTDRFAIAEHRRLFPTTPDLA